MNHVKIGHRMDNSATASSPPSHNVINSIMSFLPDNRPITSLKIVEDYEKCPKNYTCIQRTYDMDADADLWRENNLLFGRQSTRYLCISKTEGVADCILQTLKITPEKVSPPWGFTTLSRTADTDQRAWRKRQLSYKVLRRDACEFFITDIILCSKAKVAPPGFLDVGSINGILVCYKICAMPTRPAPPLPPPLLLTQQIVQAPTTTTTTATNNKNNVLKPPSPTINGIKKAMNGLLLKEKETDIHEYEEITIKSPSRRRSPHRRAPQPPTAVNVTTSVSGYNIAGTTNRLMLGTLGSYTELEGVPFMLNPAFRAIMSNRQSESELPELETFTSRTDMDYDFQLERQTLCAMKSSALKNPFFK